MSRSHNITHLYVVATIVMLMVYYTTADYILLCALSCVDGGEFVLGRLPANPQLHSPKQRHHRRQIAQIFPSTVDIRNALTSLLSFLACLSPKIGIFCICVFGLWTFHPASFCVLCQIKASYHLSLESEAQDG